MIVDPRKFSPYKIYKSIEIEECALADLTLQIDSENRYFASYRLTQKSDVFSFGVVLLEIISGRHPYAAEFPDGTYSTLIQWVRRRKKSFLYKVQLIAPARL